MLVDLVGEREKKKTNGGRPLPQNTHPIKLGEKLRLFQTLSECEEKIKKSTQNLKHH